MYRINGYDVELTRGDSLTLRVMLSGRDLPEGTDAVFTLKTKPRETAHLLQKRFDASDEQVIITLLPEETDLPPRTYYWDLRLQIPQEKGGYEIFTPMEYAAFTILDVIGASMGDSQSGSMNPDLPVLQLVLEETKAVLARANTVVSSFETLNVEVSEADAPSAAVLKHEDGSLSIALGLPRGPQGIQGPKGDKGDTGKDGTSFIVLALYATLAELKSAHPTGAEGDAYAVGTSSDNSIYIWDVDRRDWVNVGVLQGPQGPKGDTGAAGPQGDRGDTGRTGATPQMSIGMVETGAAGSNASASISGTAENPVLNLTIPRGEAGTIENVSVDSVVGLPEALAGKQPVGDYLTIDGTAADAQKLGGKTFSEMMLAMHPVGTIRAFANDVSPAALFGGTWEQLKDRFLLGAGGSYTLGSTGGEASHTLNIYEMPSHEHSPLHINGNNLTVWSTDDFGGSFDMGSLWKENGARNNNFGVGYTGGNQPHNNMPPWEAVNFWKRVA